MITYFSFICASRFSEYYDRRCPKCGTWRMDMQGFSAVITNHCSALCKALHCMASFSPPSGHCPAWSGRGETAPCHQHMHLENIAMYLRRMIVIILFYSVVDLCRTCSPMTLRQILAVPATFKCFVSGGDDISPIIKKQHKMYSLSAQRHKANPLLFIVAVFTVFSLRLTYMPICRCIYRHFELLYHCNSG